MVVNLTFCKTAAKACLSRLGICGIYLCFEIEAHENRVYDMFGNFQGAYRPRDLHMAFTN